MDYDMAVQLAHIQDAIATGRSNRYFRVQKRHGMAIRKANMEGGAAADVIWSLGEAHTSDAAREYMGLIDLERDRGVVAQFESVWPHYGEAVRNRKRCIAELAAHYAGRGGIGQLVVLGAGFDALSVELAARSGYGVQSYEADAAAMPDKRRALADMLDERAADCVRCVTMNLADTTPRRLVGKLEKEGWRYDLPSLVVVEGVSQYLPKSRLGALLSAFRTRGGSSRLVMEYIRDAGSISPGVAPVPEALFGWHGRMIGVDRLSRYSDAQALDFAAGGTGRGGRAGVAAAAAAGMAVVGPARMELARRGSNPVFPDDSSGWFAVCHGPI